MGARASHRRRNRSSDRDLGDEACFTTAVAQSTQYACAAQAVASGYGAEPKVAVGTVIGSNLPVAAATYGMLLGTLYDLLAKRRVAAHYLFVPGTIEPGASQTNVFVNEQPEYDATAAKPSTIVYFTIGSHATSPNAPSYGSVPSVPVCLAQHTLKVDVPFSGLPIYFRSHSVAIASASATFDVPAMFDPLLGYQADLSAKQYAQLAGGGSARIESSWGFGAFRSQPFPFVEPKNIAWSLPHPSGVTVVQGDNASTLTFSDGMHDQGGCVTSIVVKDGLGRAIPVSNIVRSANSVTATLDASNAGGATGEATIEEPGGDSSSPIPFTIYPALPSVTSAIAYLPKGTLVLKGTGLKYINVVTLEGTGITFGNGTPRADGSWIFAAQTPTSFEAAWEHETMSISFTLQPPDPRTDAVEADVDYAPTPAPQVTPSASS